jgi:O-antigen ligase
LLENGQFSKGLAHWFPAAQSYFVPWHIDNLFLEVLVERGLAGLLLLAALMAYALWHLAIGRARSLPLSPYLAASLCAALLVGLVSSFMDVPRVAFIFYLLTLYSVQTTQELE